MNTRNEDQKIQDIINQMPPPEIVMAANSVYAWFAERNVQYWCLGGCASRTYYEERETIRHSLARDA